MKNFYWIVLCFVSAVLSGLDYADGRNWVLRPEGEPEKEQTFDVFYVYPTIFADREKALMEWNNPGMADKTLRFSRAQTGIFGIRARVFAPYVRQLEHTRVLKSLKEGEKWETSGARQGILDTEEAFRYYMEHCNNGRPFILLGHSQGAMDLYEMLKKCPEITPEKGFAAAYLAGLPGVTAKQFSRDFAGRSIVPAQGADDAGVLVVWNTRNREAVDPMFAVKGQLCINPLNWKTDETPAGKEMHSGAVMYDYRKESFRRIPAFCGAVIDLEKGAVIVDLPSCSGYDGYACMGAGVFHINDIWFFAENLRENAENRVKTWRAVYGRKESR